MTIYRFTCGHQTQAKPMFIHCHVWRCRGVLITPVDTATPEDRRASR